MNVHRMKLQVNLLNWLINWQKRFLQVLLHRDVKKNKKLFDALAKL